MTDRIALRPRRFVSRFLHVWRSRLAGIAGPRVGVAVSGGRDSAALAVLIAALKKHLGVRSIVLLHLDHGLRPPAERRKDLAVLRALAKRCRAKLVSARARVRSRGAGLEAAGREARLAFFARAARRLRLDSIALAHHLDDRIETFFLFLLRGSGLRGLSSLRAVESIGALQLIRPLLSFTRDDLREFAADQRIAYHEDTTNLDRQFLRNRIRLDLVPMLTRWHPGFRRAMAATLVSLESEDEALSALAGLILKKSRLKPRSRRTVELDRIALQKFPAGLLARVLQMSDRLAGGSGLAGGHDTLAAAVHAIPGQGRSTVTLACGRRIRIERDRVEIGR